MKLPGNETHQKILQILIKLFKKDSNIEAFIVFGSLGRGNWDNYSDVDLDAVVQNDSEEVIDREIKHMHQVLLDDGFKILLAFAEAPNEQVIILDSLDRISIRFHLLLETNPVVLESMKVLYGNLSKEEISKSLPPRDMAEDIDLLNNKLLELAIYVPISLKRNKPLTALFFLNKMRQNLIKIYTISHSVPRELDFEKYADRNLINMLLLTYDSGDKEKIMTALKLLLNYYEKNIWEISGQKIVLSNEELSILRRVVNYWSTPEVL